MLFITGGSQNSLRLPLCCFLFSSTPTLDIEPLRYIDFNRTIADALANESILGMQGITEALSRYYYKHGDSFAGVFVVPEYQDKFAELANAAVDYYAN